MKTGVVVDKLLPSLFPLKESARKTIFFSCGLENFTYLCQPKAKELREKRLKNQAALSVSIGLRCGLSLGIQAVRDAGKFFEKLSKQ
jgi:hypothetical protein